MALTLEQARKVKSTLSQVFNLAGGFNHVSFGLKSARGAEEGYAIAVRSEKDLTDAQIHQIKTRAVGIIGRRLDDDEIEVRTVGKNSKATP